MGRFALVPDGAPNREASLEQRLAKPDANVPVCSGDEDLPSVKCRHTGGIGAASVGEGSGDIGVGCVDLQEPSSEHPSLIPGWWQVSRVLVA